MYEKYNLRSSIKFWWRKIFAKSLNISRFEINKATSFKISNPDSVGVKAKNVERLRSDAIQKFEDKFSVCD